MSLLTADLRRQLQESLGAAYILERELGGGGMSCTFVAHEAALGRKVVVKILSPELAAGVSVERFRREIQLAAQLQHPHVVPVLSSGEAAGLPWFTMPYVEGESLRQRLARAPMAIGETVSVLRDVSRALAFAHSHGVVHRDIKPDNVLLSQGSATVTDFGIAKAISVARTGPAGATLTMAGTSVGTPAYMAPEQVAGDPNIDHRSDIYSFGVMAYELVTGAPPFSASSPARMLGAHLGERPRDIREVRPDVPEALATLIMRCLEKDPATRPQEAADLAGVLDSVTSSGAAVAAPAVLRGQLRPGRAIAMWATATLLVALTAWAATRAIGLPDWVFPGSLGVMLAGLPAIAVTWYVQHAAHRAYTATPTFTPGGTPSMQGALATMAVRASPHLSWRRTWMGGAVAVGGFALLVVGFMVLRALGIGPAGSLMAAGKLEARDRLIVTDFRVRGADSALGAVISEAVRMQLGQSDVVSILSPAAVAATLERMKRPPTTLVDLALAREIAQREGAKAVVDGDVTPLGAGYVLTLRLVTADSGAELASLHETADEPKDLLPTLDKLARRLRGRMGESLRTVQSAPPLEQVTTPSLDALKRYAEGTRANNVEGDFAKSVRLLEEAVRLDTAFAEAWRKLGIAYSNSRMPRERQDSALAHAYRFRERLTELERQRAAADYFAEGPGRDRARAIAAEEDIVRRFPNSTNIYNNLALDLTSRRDHARAESLYKQQLLVDSSFVLAPTNLIRTQIDLGKLNDAASTLALVTRRFPNNASAEIVEPVPLYAQGLADSATAVFRRLRGSQFPRNRAIAVRSLSSLSLRRGRVAESVRLLAEAREEDIARGVPGSPLDDSVTVSHLDAWFETQPARAVQRLDALLSRIPLKSIPVDDREYFLIASVYAIAHRPDRARAVLAQYDAEVTDTTLRRWFEPYRHQALAEIALAERRPRDAIDEFRRGDMRPDGPVEGCPICAYAALGRAFDQAGMPDSAITMFERYLSTPFWNRFSLPADGLQLAAVYKRLGELYEERGDRPKAASYYAKFVDLWKDADPELQPKVREARARLVRLSDTERH